MSSATEIYTAFVEATIDTFDALSGGKNALADPQTLKDLAPSYDYLSGVAQVDPQVLFNNISKGAYDVIEASGHRMLVSGKAPRELTCDTCGKLISHHGSEASFKTLLTAVQDIEAIAALHEATEGLTNG